MFLIRNATEPKVPVVIRYIRVRHLRVVVSSHLHISIQEWNAVAYER